MDKQITNVDEYIAQFPQEVREKLDLIRKAIMMNAADATESISYGMPAYRLNNKVLVYFGGFEKHIGFYATPSGHDEFKTKLSKYKQGKGSVQFPLNKEMPLDLIAEIVRFRAEENLNK